MVQLKKRGWTIESPPSFCVSRIIASPKFPEQNKGASADAEAPLFGWNVFI